MNGSTIQQSFVEKQCHKATELLIQKIIEVRHFNQIDHFDDLVNDKEIKKALFSLTVWTEMLAREGI